MSHDTLIAWRDLLAEVGALGANLAGAIASEDTVGAIATTMQLRTARAALARVEVPAEIAGTQHELSAIAEVAELVENARAAELVMEQWLARPLPGDAALLGSALGIAVIADAMLPAVWDLATELVVLVGDEVAPVAELLADLGQRRIIRLGTAPGVGIGVETVDELVTAMRTLSPNPPSQVAVRGAPSARPELVSEVAERAQTTLADLRIHRNTVHAFSRTWIEQGARNLAAIARTPSIETVGQAFAKLPMVIVAPGPSLANNVDQLRALKGRAIITAFSHSLKPVLAAGVVPDLVLTVDPQDVRYHFAGCDLSETCLVNAATVHPSLFELPAARFLTLSANCAIDDWLFEATGEQPLVPGGGSVATSALSLALRWGCDPIVFVGLDLSFSNGAYYVATSSDGGARACVDDTTKALRVEGWSAGFAAMKANGGPGLATERVIELPGWHGEPVRSSFMFGLFHRWFVERLQGVRETKVYNCTEGGAFIPGMTHCRLAELAFTGEVDVAASLDRIGHGSAARTGAVAAHVRHYRRRLGRCRALANRARHMIAAGSTGPELERVEKSLARALAPLAFVSLLAQRDVDHAHDIARRAGTAGDFLAASAALLTTLDAVIAQLEPELDRALTALEPRGPRGQAA